MSGDISDDDDTVEWMARFHGCLSTRLDTSSSHLRYTPDSQRWEGPSGGDELRLDWTGLYWLQHDNTCQESECARVS